MANLREITGRACVSGNLAPEAWLECAIDRVAALGGAGRISALGVAIFRWRYAHDHHAAVAVLRMLMAHIRQTYTIPESFADGIAKQAMREFTESICQSCHGHSSVTDENGVVLDCPVCNGTGLRCYTNSERMRGSGFDVRTSYKMIEGPLESAMWALRHADNVCNVQLNLELERDTPLTTI